MGDDMDFEFEQAISRQDDDRRRLLESQGLLRDTQGGSVIVGRGCSVVCRHWLRGMCWKGEFCEFLHQYDTGRMPICRQFQKCGHCADYDRGSCVFLHERIEDGPACVHYYLGFCRAGPKCRKRHQRLDKEDLPPLVPDWYLRLVIANAWSIIPQGLDPETEEIMEHVETICRDLAGATTFGLGGKSTGKLEPGILLPVSSSISDLSSAAGDDISDRSGTGRSLKRSTIDESLLKKAQTEGEPYPLIMLPASLSGIPRLIYNHVGTPKIRVFMIKSSDLKNIHKSIRLGVWATGKQNTRLLGQAYVENDHVVLLFSANESGGFQGYGRMASPPILELYPNLWGAFSVRLGGNFRVQWLKQCRVEFERFGGLANPLNDDQPIRKSRDCQVGNIPFWNDVVELSLQELPLPLAQVVCTVLDAAADEDLLSGTDEEHKPRIDHSTWFKTGELQSIQTETLLDDVAGSSALPDPPATPLSTILHPPPPPPPLLTQPYGKSVTSGHLRTRTHPSRSLPYLCTTALGAPTPESRVL